MKEGTIRTTGLYEHVAKMLDRLDAVQASVDHGRHTRFWVQCVRDTRGNWVKYATQKSDYDIPYFRGKQETYKTPIEHKYLLAHIDTRRAFYESLPDVPYMDTDAFREWLEIMRCLLEYRKAGSTLHEKSVTDKHTQIIIEQVLPLAKKYKDPYATGLAHGPVLVGIPAGGLPFDESKNGLIYHHYPSLDYADIYLHRALATLQHLLRMDAAANRQEYIHQVAHFCQLLINLHLFAAVNISLYMNMCNGLLELAGMRGIEHGIIDFVAFRLQPDNFGRYFYDMAKEGQRY